MILPYAIANFFPSRSFDDESIKTKSKIVTKDEKERKTQKKMGEQFGEVQPAGLGVQFGEFKRPAIKKK